MSAWTKHVTQFYRDQKKKNTSYKFKNALKDARKSYKKVRGGEAPVDKVHGGQGPELPKGGRSKKRKSIRRR